MTVLNYTGTNERRMTYFTSFFIGPLPEQYATELTMKKERRLLQNHLL